MWSRRNQFLANAVVFLGIAIYGAADGERGALIAGILGSSLFLLAALHRTREDNRSIASPDAEDGR